jgi:hypothetical protein
MATAAQLETIRKLLNKLSLATQKAGMGDIIVSAITPSSVLSAGIVKQMPLIANANVDNSDAGAKINALFAALKASGQMSST